MNVLGVILARAGSQGLKDKHLLPLLDRPVISYTFDHAKASRRLTKTVVSSDCAEILRLGARAGFDICPRPAELATSTASVQDVMLHAMTRVETDSVFRADALVVLYGNIPVRAPGVIDRAIEHLKKTGCDSVRTFCPVGKWHPAWMNEMDDDKVVPLVKGSIHRRQDLPPLFLHDGGVVVVRRSSMLLGRERPEDPHAFFGYDRRGIATDPGETVEIDQLRDLYWAEAVLKEQQATRPGKRASA